MSSKFCEHLSVNLPDISVETSRRSRLHRVSHLAEATRSTRSIRILFRPPKDVEAGTPLTSSTMRDRFTNLFFDLRTLNTADPDLVAQGLSLSQRPPLHIEKHRCPVSTP
jgi:hypothetical protein